MSSSHHQGPVPVKALQGKTVLVTRPRDQAESLCRLIENAGGKAIRYPAIDISPVDDDHISAAVMKQLAESDIVIFISANAVRYSIKMLKSVTPDPQRQVAAIGRATAHALRQSEVQVNIFPDKGFTSEALLAMPQMQDVAGKSIIIVKGEGGRELLTDTLSGRGARVSTLDVYRRLIPIINIKHDDVLQAWSHGGIDAVIVTSQEIMANLFILFAEEGRYFLQHTPMVVISERLRQASEQYQMQAPVVVASEASDDAIVAALITLFGKIIPEVDDE